jgi:hypothetical protein
VFLWEQPAPGIDYAPAKARVETTGAAGVGSSYTNVEGLVVDNQNNTYFLWCYLQNEVHLTGVIIEYTYTG